MKMHEVHKVAPKDKQNPASPFKFSSETSLKGSSLILIIATVPGLVQDRRDQVIITLLLKPQTDQITCSWYLVKYTVVIINKIKKCFIN